jgi:methylaspartate ammonia-lyase
MSGLSIEAVLAVPASGGYFVDDQAAIRAGAKRDGLAYPGKPVTPGFDAIRSPAGAVSVLLVLSDGYVAHGDCVSVQYGGVGGREPRLRAEDLAERIDDQIAQRLRGEDVGEFRELAALVDRFAAEVDGFGAAASYGVSQAMLDARAHATRRTMADVVRAEWGLEHPLRCIPVFAQTGEQRHDHVDKMILKQVDSLPHGLINDPSLVGESGRALVEYVGWVRDRILRLRARNTYAPILHFDVYGLIGVVCRGELDRVADVIADMAEAARPFALRVEHPLDAGSRDGQIERLAALRSLLAERDAHVGIVADEWANTVEDIRAFNRAGAADVVQIKAPDLGGVHHIVEAVLDCRRHGVLAHLGGSCCETDRSAQVSVHVALGAGADQLLAKPGMGVDEGLQIVRNEMARALALSAVLNRQEIP